MPAKGKKSTAKAAEDEEDTTPKKKVAVDPVIANAKAKLPTEKSLAEIIAAKRAREKAEDEKKKKPKRRIAIPEDEEPDPIDAAAAAEPIDADMTDDESANQNSLTPVPETADEIKQSNKAKKKTAAPVARKKKAAAADTEPEEPAVVEEKASKSKAAKKVLETVPVTPAALATFEEKFNKQQTEYKQTEKPLRLLPFLQLKRTIQSGPGLTPSSSLSVFIAPDTKEGYVQLLDFNISCALITEQNAHAVEGVDTGVLSVPGYARLASTGKWAFSMFVSLRDALSLITQPNGIRYAAQLKDTAKMLGAATVNVARYFRIPDFNEAVREDVVLQPKVLDKKWVQECMTQKMTTVVVDRPFKMSVAFAKAVAPAAAEEPTEAEEERGGKEKPEEKKTKKPAGESKSAAETKAAVAAVKAANAASKAAAVSNPTVAADPAAVATTAAKKTGPQTTAAAAVAAPKRKADAEPTKATAKALSKPTKEDGEEEDGETAPVKASPAKKPKTTPAAPAVVDEKKKPKAPLAETTSDNNTSVSAKPKVAAKKGKEKEDPTPEAAAMTITVAEPEVEAEAETETEAEAPAPDENAAPDQSQNPSDVIEP